ncbi:MULTISPECIES: DUF917 domain-containing protein [Brevibacillus]|uniref:DUF917 domain-containing protein n=1 Tax=Brevibacillus TaxID=55080 RepID=UPI000EBF9167|nr:DUF917 domain-containing protein [Brevibacillus sp.]HBZ79150.1 DUF917 domain-containing protein [Brevibacillus sp.]
MYLEEKDVDSIACGAMFLGSGGAGDTTVLQIMAKQAIHDNGPVRLLSPFELQDDAWVVSMSMMGSPAVHYEKMMSGHELIMALRLLEEEKQIKARALIALEIGGINAITPILAAALTGLPLVDADGMGRAFPECQMTTFHAFGAEARPFIICADNGKCQRYLHPSTIEIERAARISMTNMGGSVALASFPMTGKLLQEAAIHHTFSVCKRIGESVLAAGSSVQRVYSSLAAELQNSIYGKPCKLIEGRIVELQRYLQDGFLRGELLVEGSGFHHTEQVEIEFQSEYLLARQGERIVATVPDLICILEADSGLPLMIDELEKQMKVWVIAIPCPIILRHPKMLDFVGPWNFEVGDSYVPVEQRFSEEGSG